MAGMSETSETAEGWAFESSDKWGMEGGDVSVQKPEGKELETTEKTLIEQIWGDPNRGVRGVQVKERGWGCAWAE